MVISDLQGGGAARVMSCMAGDLAAKGIDVALLTFDDPEQREAYQVDVAVKRIYCYSGHWGGSWRKIVGFAKRVGCLRRHFRAARPQAVLSFITETNVVVLLSVIGLGVRCVVSERTDPSKAAIGMFWRLTRKLLYRHADCVVAQTEQAGGWLERHVGGSVVVIPNFCREAVAGGTAASRAKVVGIGRLVPIKGFDLLIRAFAAVAARWTDWDLVLIGDGPSRESLASLARDLGLSGRVHFLGQVDHPAQFVSPETIVACPSRFEGFPNVLLEAMARGAPVVATSSAGKMLITDGVNGLLVPPEDIGQLAAAMERLMRDPLLRLELGRMATDVRRRFSQEEVMARWESVLFPAGA